jgi:hypothetical protein
MGYHIDYLPGLNVHNDPEAYYVYHHWDGTRDALAIQKKREKNG